MRHTAKPKKRNWIVEVECKVRKSLELEHCTEQEARTSPWDYSVDEREIDQMDWEVTKVEPNE